MSRKHTLIAIAVLLPALMLSSLAVIFPASAAVVLEVCLSGANVTMVQNRLIQFGYLYGVADGK